VADPHAQRICNSAVGQLQPNDTRPNHDTWLGNVARPLVEPGDFAVGVPTELIRKWLGLQVRSARSSFSEAKESDKEGSHFAALLAIKRLDRLWVGC
jgi:hypothetical protein